MASNTSINFPKIPTRNLSTPYKELKEDYKDIEKLQATFNQLILEAPEEIRNMVATDDPLCRKLMCPYAAWKIRRFPQTNEMQDIEDALCAQSLAVEKALPHHPDLAGMLYVLSTIYLGRFNLLNDVEDLDLAIQKAQLAVNILPEGRPEPFKLLNKLSHMFKLRFKKLGNFEDLEEQIHWSQQDAEVYCPDDKGLRATLHALRLVSHYEATQDIDDLDRAIEGTREAIRIVPLQHPHIKRPFNLLADILSVKYKKTGSVDALDECLEILEILDTVNSDDADLLSTFCDLLLCRFRIRGNKDDLERSIQVGHKALKVSSSQNGAVLNVLSNALAARSETTYSTLDLREAVQKARQAVFLTPPNDPNFPGYLNDFGIILFNLFQKTREMGHLDEAIQAIQKVLQITSPTCPVYFNNLSIMLLRRYEKTDAMEDLEGSIKNARQAIANAHSNHPKMPMYLNNLSSALSYRFQKLRIEQDINESTEKAKQAVRHTPVDHPSRAKYLYTLGMAYSSCSQISHAIDAFTESWNNHNYMPFDQVLCIFQAIRLLKQQRRWSEALGMMKQALQAIPRINSQSLSRDDQQSVLSRFNGLAADTCSTCLLLGGSAFEAVQLLEAGRGVILGRLLEDESHISKLKQEYPELAAAYVRVLSEVHGPMDEMQELDVTNVQLARKVEAITELDQCISRIRDLYGYEQFLCGISLEELKMIANEGPIVVVNVTNVRSDSIIITPLGVSSIEHPSLSKANVINWFKEGLTTYTVENSESKNQRYLQFLSWLWSSCVEAILHKIFNQRPEPTKLPRIWWIPTGVACCLPFHAAGNHGGRSTDNALHWVMSSYAPTIKVLAHAKARKPTSSLAKNAKPKLLIVTMPKTPGLRDLPGAEAERAEIEVAVSSKISCHTLVQPSARTILDHLGHFDMFHFAGHGISDFANPSNSCLVLRDMKGPVTIADKLTVREVSNCHSVNGRIAFLSACSTAKNTLVLPDEVIHLASGFEAAGFNHVISSMWSVDDRICAKAAKCFYTRLMNEYEDQQAGRTIVEALHNSIMEVRKLAPNRPLLWAPYVHFGA